MKVIDSLAVRMRLAVHLPGNPSVWLPDREYQIPAKAEVEALLQETWFEKYAYKPPIRDCDKYALLLLAYVAQERARRGEELAWAFGEAWYRYADRPEDEGHALNVVITQEGVFCVEPQTDLMSRPDRDLHSYFYVRM